MILTPSILITDDDLAFRETVSGLLERRGLRTLAAGDGQEAIDILARERVDLMLLDMHMPRMTGLQTLEVVRRRWRMPCILMSADLDEEIARRARRAQVIRVLAKPVSGSDLTSAVDYALEHAGE